MSLESTIRTLQHITFSSLREVDCLAPYRELLSKHSRLHKGDKSKDFVPAADQVGLWGVTDEYKSVFDRARDLGAEYRNRWTSKSGRGKVTVLFVYSPPGCGKETVWSVLCAAACENRLVDARRTEVKKVAIAGKGSASAKAEADHVLEKVKKYFEVFSQGSPPYPLSSVLGSHLHGRVLPILYGEREGSDGPQWPGRLALMHYLHHPLFIDEFNTMHREDADDLLRLLAQENEAFDAYLDRQVELDIPILFASNRSVPDLVEKEPRFNNALRSRF